MSDDVQRALIEHAQQRVVKAAIAYVLGTNPTSTRSTSSFEPPSAS